VFVSSKEPLVNFHLAFVAFVPGLVQLRYLLVFAGGFIVDHYVLLLGVFPEVVDSAGDQKISVFMEVLDTCEVLAPGVEILVRYWNGVDAVMFHQRVFGSLGSVKVKLFFEESINGNVQGEGESRRSADSEPAIHVKAAWAF
jgi:hypothetical protein